jgi:hypothetical protein
LERLQQFKLASLQEIIVVEEASMRVFVVIGEEFRLGEWTPQAFGVFSSREDAEELEEEISHWENVRRQRVVSMRLVPASQLHRDPS